MFNTAESLGRFLGPVGFAVTYAWSISPSGPSSAYGWVNHSFMFCASAVMLALCAVLAWPTLTAENLMKWEEDDDAAVGGDASGERSGSAAGSFSPVGGGSDHLDGPSVTAAAFDVPRGEADWFKTHTHTHVRDHHPRAASIPENQAYVRDFVSSCRGVRTSRRGGGAMRLVGRGITKQCKNAPSREQTTSHRCLRTCENGSPQRRKARMYTNKHHAPEASLLCSAHAARAPKRVLFDWCYDWRLDLSPVSGAYPPNVCEALYPANLAHRVKNAAVLTPYQVEQRDETMMTEARPNENCKEPASRILRLFIKCVIKRSQP